MGDVARNHGAQMKAYKSRKFILCLMTLCICSWLVYEHLIDAEVFKTIILGTLGVYVIGNVSQKVLVKDVVQ